MGPHWVGAGAPAFRPAPAPPGSRAQTSLCALASLLEAWEIAAPAAPLNTAITRGELLAPSSCALLAQATLLPSPLPFCAGRRDAGADRPGFLASGGVAGWGWGTHTHADDVARRVPVVQADRE